MIVASQLVAMINGRISIMSTNPLPHMSSEEFLKFLDGAEGRYEFHLGEVLPREASTQRHNDIAFNIRSALRGLLPSSSCRVYGIEVTVEVAGGSRYVEPDVVVYCNEADRNAPKIKHPLLVFEVWSEATEDYDRGRKFEYYRTNDSFAEYVMVAQERTYVEHHWKIERGIWQMQSYTHLGAEIRLASIDAVLRLSVIYEGVF